MKTCNSCGLEKALENFCKNKSQRDGLERRCKKCRALYREMNREQIATKKAVDYLLNRDAERAKRKRNREQNPEAAAARFARWKAKNGSRFKEYQLAYRHANAARKASYQKSKAVERLTQESARRARKLKATPAWANAEKVAEIYEAADMVRRALGVAHHVDHVVPLNSRLVCGLHNEFNLQILPASINQSKGNRYWPDMP